MLVEQANSRRSPHNYFPESHIEALNQVAKELKDKRMSKKPTEVLIPLRRKKVEKQLDLLDFL